MTVTERELFAAYRHGSRYVAPCLCGLPITSRSAGEIAVTIAVGAHRKTTVHLAYMAWQVALDDARRRHG